MRDKATTIREIRPIKIPLTTEDGEEVLVRICIKITMEDKSIWTYTFRSKTWTHTQPPLYTYHRSGTIAGIGEPRITRIGTTSKLMEKMGHCKRLIDVLTKAMEWYQ